ncbi:penicillin-binding protein activator LpoB [Moritella sp. 24]|uniref:penicillin-binding protein activator LpoB n=1 Tax=Moritella sp. 24 TaxID=2746230 RepID=UPI001BADDA0A|nr:penicillin-binding protein activator LpoB [Moritella sp. 24]QUM77262.1 penicillin-binding protein activator LpoB [Moritella sp. 24]
MKWILTLIYISSALFVTGCTSQAKPERQLLSAPLEAIIEHPLTTKVRELSWQLLQQPYFVQGSFEHGEALFITHPDTASVLPTTSNELQRASAETLDRLGWFDIQTLTEIESQSHLERIMYGYSLVINVDPVSRELNKHMLTIELINNRFKTVEAHVNSIVSL